ncbi:hypothetical protein [Leadbettera azotonutricia]|uniref:Outer membrane protein beta-barrel domain-containing protein n=1 Tax=Leadbettera azotonutricia (strain ATCC BAA-888 / DSM 13862 / ZAS-9) TaxID=545695 RepID=F5Y6Q2_LEAAZ|nr:hypothetical protein [Leadbettera azotonutricia]AEF81450.1 hypothetical protein TREAZ_1218 [Leadbettera azotonutricia ZAS-9]
MKRTFPLRRFLMAFAVFGALALPLEAQGFFSRLTWAAEGSVLFFPEDNGMHSDPMPVLPSPGVAVSYPLPGPMHLELTLDLYFTHYGYDFDLDRAVPYAIENRSSFVLGSVLGLQAMALFDIGSRIDVRAYGGFAADLRIVLLAEDLNSSDFTGVPQSDPQIQTDAVRDYFWSSGRWLLPVIGGGMDFDLNSKLKLGLDLRVWFPLYKVWTAENLPAVEGWRFGIGARITFRRNSAVQAVDAP